MDLCGLWPYLNHVSFWSMDANEMSVNIALILGVTEMILIAAEIAVLYQSGFFFFSPIIAGVATIALLYFPSVRRYYHYPKKSSEELAARSSSRKSAIAR